MNGRFTAADLSYILAQLGQDLPLADTWIYPSERQHRHG